MHLESYRLAIYTGSAAHGLRDSICMRKLHSFCMFLAGQGRFFEALDQVIKQK